MTPSFHNSGLNNCNRMNFSVVSSHQVCAIIPACIIQVCIIICIVLCIEIFIVFLYSVCIITSARGNLYIS